MPLEDKQYLILIPRGWTNRHTKRNPWKWFSTEYPAIANHLKQFENKAIARGDKGDYWWELRACTYYDEFEKPKLLLPDISLRGNCTLDSKNFFCVNTSYMIGVDDKYLLALINSKLMDFVYRQISSSYRGGYLRYIYQYLAFLPIRIVDYSTQSEVNKQNDLINLASEMIELKARGHLTPNDKEFTERRMATIDSQIDQLVFEMYGLTEIEISLIDKF